MSTFWYEARQIVPLPSSVISDNIKEMMHGPRHAENLKKFGKAKADKITVAAAESMAHRKSK